MKLIKAAKETPNDEKLRSLAKELINGQSAMTVATGRSNIAWAAPVYYVLHTSDFYFFSDPKSRHIIEALESKQASVAIHAFASTWREIRGIQMSGRIQAVRTGIKAIQAIRAYLKKFPFAKEFFSDSESLDLTSFGKTFGVRLYKFRPDLIYYTDNRIHFGFRSKISL